MLPSVKLEHNAREMPQAVFPENQAQLDDLAELHRAFRQQGITFWLRGGWALDFLLGRETRPHGDVDVVVWNEHRESIRPLFTELQYDFRDRGFRGQMDFVRSGVNVSMIFLENQENGDLTPTQCPQLIWLPDALGQAKTLHGLTCRTITPQQLIQEKQMYEGNQPLRPKDIESLRLLNALLMD